MSYYDNPEAVADRYIWRASLSPFEREMFHAEMDASERRSSRRYRHKPRYVRPSDWIGDEQFRHRTDDWGLSS